MEIALKINQAGEKHYMRYLACQLEKHIDKAQTTLIYDKIAPPSSALSSLLMVEKQLLRKNQICGADRILKGDLNLPNATDKSILIDLTYEGKSPNGLAPSFNGCFGFESLAALLLEGQNPIIEIVDLQKNCVLVQGKASLEAANGLGGAMEALYSRVATLLVKALKTNHHQRNFTHSDKEHTVTFKRAGPYALKNLVKNTLKQIYHLCCYPSHWRIGWRFINDAGVLENLNLKGPAWQVLDHPADHFYADPFPFLHKGKNYLFFEDLDHHHGKGVISYVPFDEHGPAQKATMILEEATHLSYPFLIEHDGEIYMMPESSLSGEVVLYRATRFPDKWERFATLLSNVEAADATLIKHQGKWWLFAVIRDGVGGYSDSLHLFYATTLFGPYNGHPLNPIIVDPETARPAGAMVLKENTLWRPVQNCGNGYGAALSLAKINTLDEQSFSQEIIHTLYPEKPHWPGRKVHTLNKAGTLEVIDGCIYRPKLPFLAKLADQYYNPR